MRVLGVDPGLTRCGLGIVEGGVGQPLHMLDHRLVQTSPTAALETRLLAIDQAIAAALDRWQPDVVAIERVFSQHNVRTVMGVAQVSGVVVVAAGRRELSVAWHTPSEVKAAVTGQGRASKDQVAGMVGRLLRLSEPPKPVDITDALALAICHIWRGGAQLRVSQALAVARSRAGR